MSSNGSGWQGREVVIVEAARTPIGRGHAEKGAFGDVHPNALLLVVWQRDGHQTRQGSARLRVRAATRLELCLPAELGAYPSYCAPEKAPQGG